MWRVSMLEPRTYRADDAKKQETRGDDGREDTDEL
jgi:hypothetical protein